MKRLLLLFFLAAFVHSCNTYDHIEPYENDFEPVVSDNLQKLDLKLQRIEGALFINQNDKFYEVDQKVITVKSNNRARKSEEAFPVIRTNRLGYQDIRIPDDMDVEEYVASLEKTGYFEVIEFNTIGEYCFTPNDPRVQEQWHLQSLEIYSAWNFTTGDTNIKIAVLDSGTDWQHEDLGNGSDGYTNIAHALGWNYITNTDNVITTKDHGTLVAGIIGAKTNNAKGVSGISGGNNSSGITIIPYCVGISNPDGSVIDDAIIDAVEAGARIIQFSLSVGRTSAIDAAIDYAIKNNVIIVCASGNGYTSTITYPASHESVIAVGAIDETHQRAAFSNYGTGLDVVAPGDNIWSTTLNNRYALASGTSFAAPMVSAVAALILAERPNLKWDEVRAILRSTSKKLSGYSFTNGWNNEVGYGLVDASKALGNRILREAGVQRYTPALITWDNVPERNDYNLYYTITVPQSYYQVWEENSGTTFNFVAPYSGYYTLYATLSRPNGATYTATKSLHVLPNAAYIQGTSLGPGETGTFSLRTYYSDPVDPVVGGKPVNQLLHWQYGDGVEFVSSTPTTITLRSTRTADECGNRICPIKLTVNPPNPSVSGIIDEPLEYTGTITLTAPNSGEVSIDYGRESETLATIKHHFTAVPASGEFRWEYASLRTPNQWMPIPSSNRNIATIELPKYVGGFVVRVARTSPCGVANAIYTIPD